MKKSTGFTLIELMIVLGVISLMLAISITAYHSFSGDQQLHGAAQAVGAQVQLARMRAMSTGITQTVNFNTTTTPPSVYVLDSSHARSWTLPKGITFATGGASSFTLTSDGRASASQYIVIQNAKGLRDPVSVETSGLVLAR